MADKGKRVIIVWSLYGLKSAGAAFRNQMQDCMNNLGYESCPADPDLWLKPMTQLDDGVLYYAYVLLYVNDVLYIHHDAE